MNYLMKSKLLSFYLLISIMFFMNQPLAQANKDCNGISPCYIEYWGGEPIQNESLILLGKGVKGKKTGQVLVAACVGENNSCEKIRFAYYPTEHQGYWVSPILALKDLTDKKGRKITTRMALKKSLKRYMKEFYDGNEVVGTVLAVGSAVAGIITGLAGAPLLVTGALVTVGISGMAVGTSSPMSSFDPRRITQQHFINDVGQEVTNQSDWNWSETPSKIKEKFISQFQYNLEGDWNIYFEEFNILPSRTSEN